jgi:hypothetical protein
MRGRRGLEHHRFVVATLGGGGASLSHVATINDNVLLSSPALSCGRGRGRGHPPEPERVVGTAEARGHRRPSGGTPRRFKEAVVPYCVDSSDGMASPAGSEERQRCQAFRKSKPPSGPSATGIPSMR